MTNVENLAGFAGRRAAPADQDERPDLLAGLRDGAWLDAQQFPPLAYAVPGIIPEGSTLLVGPPKIGKSWFVLACALAVASGGYALGRIPVDKRTVLYLALEDGDRRLQDRCRKLLEGGAIPPAFQYLTYVTPALVVPTIEQWLGRQHDAAPVVILDTLGKVMPPALNGESAYGRDYRVGSRLKQIADDTPGSAMLTSHHERKATTEDFVDSVSGTHGLAGAADTIVVLNRKRHETTGQLKVTGRDVEEGEYALTYANGSMWRLDGGDLSEAAAKAAEDRVTAGLGDRSAEIVAFVGTHGTVSVSQVVEQFGEDARRYLARLVENGRLQRPRRGTYTPVPSVPLSQVCGDKETHGTQVQEEFPA